jgi:hypothetical protein
MKLPTSGRPTKTRLSKKLENILKNSPKSHDAKIQYHSINIHKKLCRFGVLNLNCIGDLLILLYSINGNILSFETLFVTAFAGVIKICTFPFNRLKISTSI